MIRKLQKADLNDVANLWLDTNLKAHNFISAEYWKTNFEFEKCYHRRKSMYMKMIKRYKAL